MQRLWSERCNGGMRPLTDAELDASVECILSGAPQGDDIWVFGYGSLVWNPLFHYAERQTAMLRGFHRRFCLWSMTSRGTTEQPGLVLGLDHGGACCGVAFRLHADQAVAELRLLWRREMAVGAYCPRWVNVRTEDGIERRALTFIVNRRHPNYAGNLSPQRVADTLACASGHIGTSAEYFFETLRALIAHGLRDRYLLHLEHLLRTRHPTAR